MDAKTRLENLWLLIWNGCWNPKTNFMRKTDILIPKKGVAILGAKMKKAEHSRFGEFLDSSPKFQTWKWAQHLANEALKNAPLTSQEDRLAKIDKLRDLCRSLIQRGPTAADDIKNRYYTSGSLSSEYVERMTHILRTAGAMHKLSVAIEGAQDHVTDALSIIEDVVLDWASVTPLSALQAMSGITEDIGFSPLTSS
ncbi:MAG: hypothetical protein Q9160_008525 [Pyrenula sp. 1 TL-2023]